MQQRLINYTVLYTQEKTSWPVALRHSCPQNSALTPGLVTSYGKSSPKLRGVIIRPIILSLKQNLNILNRNFMSQWQFSGVGVFFSWALSWGHFFSKLIFQGFIFLEDKLYVINLSTIFFQENIKNYISLLWQLPSVVVLWLPYCVKKRFLQFALIARKSCSALLVKCR